MKKINRKSLILVAAGITAVIAVALLLQTRSGDTPKNLLLITVDTLRADHLGAYGYKGLISPHMDAFAKEAVLFEKASATAPFTAPSHASILTSQHPSNHGIVFNGNRKSKHMAKEFPTIGEHLQRQGYITGALVSTGCLYGKYSFNRGFSVFRELRTNKNKWRTPSGEDESGCWGKFTTQEAVRFLKQRRHQSFFLWAHYYDVHFPYFSPKEIYETLQIPHALVKKNQAKRNPDMTRHAYRAEVYEVDKYVGELLDALDELGMEDNTVVAITSDHGEYLGEHGYYSHHKLYEEVLHVPMMIRAPGLQKGTRRTDQVSTIDLVPTLLKLIGLPPMSTAAGRDLFAPGAEHKQSPAFAEWRDYYLLDEYNKEVKDHYFQISAIKNDKKLIQSVSVPDKAWLFDLERDPEEKKNLSSTDLKLKKKMDKILDDHVHSDLVKGLAIPGDTHLDEETVKMLKNLGYLE